MLAANGAAWARVTLHDELLPLRPASGLLPRAGPTEPCIPRKSPPGGTPVRCGPASGMRAMSVAGVSDAFPDAQPRRRLLLNRFWQSAREFWSLKNDRASWGFSGAVLVAIIFSLVTAYGMNIWNRAVFDALERRDAATVLYWSMFYLPLLCISVCLVVAQVYARMMLQLRWRVWLNDHVLDRWVAKGRFYQLNILDGDHANPEYRIADDIRVATEAPVELAAGITTAVLSATTFIVVLWSIGGSISFEAGGRTWTVPGFLVIAAVLYALVASWSMTVIGRGFVVAAEKKSQAEATYRYSLTRLRENGESIAVLHGEPVERGAIDRQMSVVQRSWREICRQTMRTTIVSQTSGYVAWILPIILCAPKFLDGSMSLGQVMQAASAFTTVQFAFNWLVDNYPRLSEWSASASRVASLLRSLDSLDGAEQNTERIARAETTGTALRLCNLTVTLKDGTVVAKGINAEVSRGDRVLISGESGTGKSTLVRAIAGLWPWGSGRIEIERGARMLLMPQRPYIPVGALRHAVTYPLDAERHELADIATALELVGLDYLVPRISEEAQWDQMLSGGEKQRLAFARILLHRPEIVVLDEATSALDPLSQDQMMELLACELAASTIISVSHRPELEAFHTRRITLERRSNGARMVADERLRDPGVPVSRTSQRMSRLEG